MIVSRIGFDQHKAGSQYMEEQLEITEDPFLAVEIMDILVKNPL